jgi:membrane-associated phospholipid phosphatase
VNEAVLDFINGAAGRSHALDQVGLFVANQGIYVLAALIAGFGLYELRRDRRRAVEIGAAGVLALVLALVAVVICGQFVNEARPFVHDRDTVLLMKHAADNSFPSDHATVAFAAAVVAALAWPRWAAAFIVGALAIGLARVFAGVHYPGDIVGGAAVGSLAAVAAWAAVQRVAPLVEAHWKPAPAKA